MRGSICWQVTEVFKNQNNLGTSKHEAKAEARAEGAKTWEDIGQAIGIHGQSTYQDYINITKDAFSFAREEYGLRDLTRIEPHMIQAFLMDKIENGGRNDAGVARATYSTYSSALHKLEASLNKYSIEKDLGRQFDFGLKDIGKYAALKLGEKNVSSRAYNDAKAVAGGIPGKHNLLGNVLQETGARISEVSNLKADQLRGLYPDPHSGEIKGWVNVVGKGGKHCDKGMTPSTYARLEKAINEGKANFNHGNFREQLKISAIKNGEKYSGAHSLRWSWAQSRHAELQKLGLSYESSLSIISKEMSHNRSDITCHYLH